MVSPKKLTVLKISDMGISAFKETKRVLLTSFRVTAANDEK